MLAGRPELVRTDPPTDRPTEHTVQQLAVNPFYTDDWLLDWLTIRLANLTCAKTGAWCPLPDAKESNNFGSSNCSSSGAADIGSGAYWMPLASAWLCASARSQLATCNRHSWPCNGAYERQQLPVASCRLPVAMQRASVWFRLRLSLRPYSIPSQSQLPASVRLDNDLLSPIFARMFSRSFYLRFFWFAFRSATLTYADSGASAFYSPLAH